MMKGDMSGAVSGASKSKTVVEEKRKRSQFHTRFSMDFDPKITKLYSQEEVDEYLAKYSLRISPGIKVEFCPQGVEFALPPPNSDVYMHSQILALGLKLSLMKFICNVLTHHWSPLAVVGCGLAHCAGV